MRNLSVSSNVFVLCRPLAALFVGALAVASLGVRAQETTGPRLVVGAGVAGQRESNRDLGSAGLTADVGLAWRVAAVDARLSATIFASPVGQGCSCDPGQPPLGVQGAYGVVAAIQSRPRAQPLYGLAGVGWRRGGFRTWHEHESASLLVGGGWAFGAARQGALEVHYEHFFSPLGATRALVPLYVRWRL